MRSTPTTPATAAERDPRWAVAVARDPKTDGQFHYSVETTGVYCRPSCGARLPLPAGSTVSCSEVAERIGAPKAVRAVAQACGANTLAIAIPCHRVVRRDGGTSGYRWGAERKHALLEREART